MCNHYLTDSTVEYQVINWILFVWSWDQKYPTEKPELFVNKISFFFQVVANHKPMKCITQFTNHWHYDGWLQSHTKYTLSLFVLAHANPRQSYWNVIYNTHPYIDRGDQENHLENHKELLKSRFLLNCD